MKISRSTPVFKPVTITLESIEEVALLAAGIGMTSPAARAQVSQTRYGCGTVTNVAVGDLYHELNKIALS